MPELIECPEPGCQVAAEVLDRVVVGSTSGPVELVRTLCLRRHLLVTPRQLQHG